MDNVTSNPKPYGVDSVKDGWIAPILQAFTTGLLTGLALAAVDWGLGLGLGWRVALSAVPVVWLLAWLASLRGWRNRLERLTGLDLDRNGYVGEPEPEAEPQPPQRLEVKLYTNGGRNMEVIDLPGPDLLPTFARGLLEYNKPLTQTAWTGSAGPYSRSQFDELRNELIHRGLARWKNPAAPAQGCELSPAGRAVMRRIIEAETNKP